MITDINNVCICYNLFILFRANTLLIKVYSKFVSTIKATVIVDNNSNYCRHTDNSSHFCKSCYSITVKKKIPKFGSAKYINVLPCQKYSDIFNDLTSVKKAFITCTHLVMSVIKLKPSGFRSTVLYYWIWGHTVILIQNPGLLLTILLSSILAPYNMICIVLASKYPHTPFDICFFVYVWKIRVLKILR